MLELEYKEFKLEQSSRGRGRPRKVATEEEIKARLLIKLETQKKWIQDNPELYRETVRKTQEKNREKINQRARERRAILKALKLEKQ